MSSADTSLQGEAQANARKCLSIARTHLKNGKFASALRLVSAHSTDSSHFRIAAPSLPALLLTIPLYQTRPGVQGQTLSRDGGGSHADW